jgi:hypothetical protein
MQLRQSVHLPTADSQSSLPAPTNHTPLLTLVWLKSNRAKYDARKIVESMLRHSYGPYGPTATIGGDAELAWGILLPERFAPLTCWSIYTNGFELCLFEGDMYDNLDGLKLNPGDNPELARRVAAHMRHAPDRRLSDLKGIYSGLYVNRDRTCAYLFGDLTGTRPVFWLSDEQWFIATGNLWAFRGCDGFQRRWDDMALMEILTIGFPLAGRTWMAGVEQLQRGRQIRSWRDGRTEKRQLFQPIPRQSWSLQRSVRFLRESLDETVGRICRRLDRPVGLALTGGLDSRILLSSLYTQGFEHSNYTFCNSIEENDNRIARSLTEALKLPHKSVVLDGAKESEKHREFQIINEGESPGYGYCLLAAHAREDVETLMIGYESMRVDPPGAFDPFSVHSKPDLARLMLRGYMSQFGGEQASKIIAPPHHIPWKDVLEEWFESFEGIDEDSIIHVCLHHMTEYKHQRVQRPRIDSARWFCLPVYPYMDDQLYTVYYNLPVDHLKADRAHLALLSDYKLGLEKVRAAASHFMPIYNEYRYRHIIHLGRVAHQRLFMPLRTKWEETKGVAGFGGNILYSHWKPEVQQLRHCDLFNWSEVQTYLERARSGRFVNRNAIACLIKALIINDFLFSGERPIKFTA